MELTTGPDPEMDHPTELSPFPPQAGDTSSSDEHSAWRRVTTACRGDGPSPSPTWNPRRASRASYLNRLLAEPKASELELEDDRAQRKILHPRLFRFERHSIRGRRDQEVASSTGDTTPSKERRNKQKTVFQDRSTISEAWNRSFRLVWGVNLINQRCARAALPCWNIDTQGDHGTGFLAFEIGRAGTTGFLTGLPLLGFHAPMAKPHQRFGLSRPAEAPKSAAGG